ncbi:hypothetical protein [Bradyrhizobium sp. ORS 111]|uniref:hypothetical protein n=1 Tax=Bradyrhizobium sp. ORS 111 TaxID=1685958 RepID=UPI003890F3B3
MKNVLLATVALIALTAPALAADLAPRPYYTKAAKEPPIIVPFFDWTGFYVGINGGGCKSAPRLTPDRRPTLTPFRST